MSTPKRDDHSAAHTPRKYRAIHKYLNHNTTLDNFSQADSENYSINSPSTNQDYAQQSIPSHEPNESGSFYHQQSESNLLPFSQEASDPLCDSNGSKDSPYGVIAETGATSPIQRMMSGEEIGYGSTCTIPPPKLVECRTNSSGLGLPYLTSSLDLVQIHQKYRDTSRQCQGLMEVLTTLEKDTMYSFQNIINLALGAKTWIQVLRKEVGDIQAIMKQFQHFIFQSLYYFQTYVSEEVQAYQSRTESTTKQLVESNLHLSEKFNTAQLELSALETSNRCIQDRVRALQKVVKSLRKENETLKEYVTSEKNDIVDLLNDKMSKIIPCLTSTAELRDNLDKSHHENQQLEQRIKTLCQEKKVLQQQFDHATSDRDQSALEIAQQKQKSAVQAKTIEDLTADLADLREKNNQLTENYDALKKRLHAATEYKEKTNQLQKHVLRRNLHGNEDGESVSEVDRTTQRFQGSLDQLYRTTRQQGDAKQGQRLLTATVPTKTSIISPSPLPTIPVKTIDFSTLAERALNKAHPTRTDIGQTAPLPVVDHSSKITNKLPSIESDEDIMTDHQKALLSRVKHHQKQKQKKGSHQIEASENKTHEDPMSKKLPLKRARSKINGDLSPQIKHLRLPIKQEDSDSKAN